MTGLQRSAGQFFTFLATVFMGSVFGSSVGFFMAATIGSFGESISISRCAALYSHVIAFSSSGSQYWMCTDIHHHAGVQWLPHRSRQRVQLAIMDPMDQRFQICVECRSY